MSRVSRGTPEIVALRDFGDVWSLSRQHVVSADDLSRAIATVARHRGANVRPLADVLDGYADLSQGRWAQWRRRSSSEHVPEQFSAVLATVIDFADAVLSGGADGRTWHPDSGDWT